MVRVKIERKEDWNTENASGIAETMGVECDQLFVVFLTVFLDEVVRYAELDQFLIPLAINYYKNFAQKKFGISA